MTTQLRQNKYGWYEEVEVLAEEDVQAIERPPVDTSVLRDKIQEAEAMLKTMKQNLAAMENRETGDERLHPITKAMIAAHGKLVARHNAMETRLQSEISEKEELKQFLKDITAENNELCEKVETLSKELETAKQVRKEVETALKPVVRKPRKVAKKPVKKVKKATT